MNIDFKWLIIGLLLGYFGTAILSRVQSLFSAKRG